MHPIHSTTYRFRTNGLNVFLTGTALALALCTPLDSVAQEASLRQAVAAYESADFTKAIDLFSVVARDPDADKAARKEALQFLGRAYLAKSMEDEAREVLAELIELEPPIVELNPDEEPPTLMNLYYEVRKEVTGGYEVERRDAVTKTLAIVDFTNSSIGDDFEKYASLTRGFASMMINYLNGATELKVVERERLQWLLQEQQLQRDADVVDQSTAVQAGKLLGAQAVLIGSYIINGNRIRMLARLNDVETGEVLLTEQIDGKTSDFLDLVQQLSTQVARAINVELAQAPTGSGMETNSLDAVISYSEGLALLEQQDYRAAYEKFLEAVHYDPGYTRATLKAKSLVPMMAAR